MTTGQKIYECRKKAGMTQEELAEKLGVSRQAVSKWESNAAFPETEKILELCKLFSLSADELLFGQEGSEKDAPPAEAQEPKEERPSGIFMRSENMHFEYVSQRKVFGMPLVHINFGLGVYRAKGIIAIGNIATGFFSLGFLSVGLLSFGLLAIGLLAFGTLAIGLILGAGAIGVGMLAFGGVAIGVMSFGGLAIGDIAVGGASIGRYAMGDWASGYLAVGKSHATGENAFLVPDMLTELRAFCDESVGGWLGSFIKSVANTLG